MDKAPPITELVLRTSEPAQGRFPGTFKPAGLLQILRLEWSLRAMEALVPVITAPLVLNVSGAGDTNDLGEAFSVLALKLPEKILDGPVGTEFAPSSLTMPTDIIVVGPMGDGPLITPLTIPEAIVEDGPVRPSANKPVPASFQQARRQRYIYDW